MATSDAAANAALDRETKAGGSWWVGLALEMPDDHLSSVSEAPLARVELPRTSAAWAAASGRTVSPKVALSLPSPSVDFTPLAWVFWDAATGGTPQHASRLVDVDVVAGSDVSLPPETLSLVYP